jgi:hypothetical protein
MKNYFSVIFSPPRLFNFLSFFVNQNRARFFLASFG